LTSMIVLRGLAIQSGKELFVCFAVVTNGSLRTGNLPKESALN